MLKLYFGNTITLLSTLLIFVFLGIFVFVLLKRVTITHWGWLVLLVTFVGLGMSVLSGFKDGMGSTEQVIPNGTFAMTLLMILGFAGIVIGIVSIFLRSQDFRQLAFFIIAGIIISKILVTEVYRIVHYFSTIV